MPWWAYRWIFHWRQGSGFLMQPFSYASRSGHFTCTNGAKRPHVTSASPAEGTEPLQTEGRLSSYHNDLKGADLLLPSCYVEIHLHSNSNSSLCCWKRQGEDTGKLCWEVILRGQPSRPLYWLLPEERTFSFHKYLSHFQKYFCILHLW